MLDDAEDVDENKLISEVIAEQKAMLTECKVPFDLEMVDEENEEDAMVPSVPNSDLNLAADTMLNDEESLSLLHRNQSEYSNNSISLRELRKSYTVAKPYRQPSQYAPIIEEDPEIKIGK